MTFSHKAWHCLENGSVTYLQMSSTDVVYVCVYACMHACIFGVNIDALAQADDFQIERWQVVFICWMQDSMLGRIRHHIASRMNAHSQTELSSSSKNLNSTAYGELSFNPPDCRLIFAPGYGYIHVSCYFRIERRPVFVLCWMQDSKLRSLRQKKNASRLNAYSQTDWAIEDQAKTWSPSLWWMGIQPT